MTAVFERDAFERPRWSIERHRVANVTATVAAFDDSTWPLAALAATVGETTAYRVSFKGLVGYWGELARWLAYVWVNFETPHSLLSAPNSRRVRQPLASTVSDRCLHLRLLAAWLDEEGVPEAGDVDRDHIIDWAKKVRRGRVTSHYANLRLGVLEDWKAASPLLPERFRLSDDLDVSVPPVRTPKTGVNKTRRIGQATMGPLLWWAETFVTEFIDDVLVAVDFVQEAAAPPNPPFRPKARALYEGFIRSGQGAPRRLATKNQVASAYLTWLHGVPLTCLSHIYTSEFADRLPLAATPECPLVGLTFSADHFDLFAGYYDFVGGPKEWPEAVRMLQTASMILVAYLTGARPDEVRRLKPGCVVVDDDFEDGVVRYFLSGTATKQQPEADGLHVGPRAAVDVLWGTVAQAADAARAAERIRERFAPTSAWLFNGAYGLGTTTSRNARDDIQMFMEYVNTRVAGTSLPTIPNDPNGPITLRRFRRTLAYFIRSQPDGEAVLGVQYQQLSPIVGTGYAAVGEVGLRDVLDEEGREFRANVLNILTSDFLAGAGVAGPAAARAARAAARWDEAGGSFMTAAEAKMLLSDPDMQVYDNPKSLMLCVYDPLRALCERPEENAAPNLLGCVESCTNRATMDSHADALDAKAVRQLKIAEESPAPMARQLRRQAARLSELAAKHRENAVVVVEVEEVSV